MLLLLPCPTAAKSANFSNIPRLARTSRFSPGLLPFSFNQVLGYFDAALQKPGHTARSDIREYVENNALGEYAAVIVSGSGQKVRVAVVTNGDWGVNYIREFFEAPFFLRSESERLYTLLGANPSARCVNLGRFDVQIKVIETRQWIIITAEFGPPGSHQSLRAL